MNDRVRSVRHPVRIIHLGLGAFHRSHQAWYTQLANDEGGDWGIAAFTGRSAAAAEVLSAQDDVYTLIERAADGDSATQIESISAACDGADVERWREAFCDPAVAVVTLTITEAGYRVTSEGELDLADADLRADIELLAAPAFRAAITAPGRLVDGLRARRASGGGPLAIVSCDNRSDNGRVTRTAVLGVAARVDPDLAAWIERSVSFVSTMVDRITPATTAADRETAFRLTGFRDAAPVVAEPFSEWILAGEFPGGRPAWHEVGARFVADIEPWEQRKLWLLNAAHSLLAYRGLALGHTTVGEAMLDSRCVDLVEALWNETRPILPFDEAEVDAALAALRTRWANPRIAHHLAQVATDGSQKLPPRIIEPIRRRLALGLDPGDAHLAALAAWVVHLSGPYRADPGAAGLKVDSLNTPGGLEPHAAASAVLEFLAPDLAAEPNIVDSLAAQVEELQQLTEQGVPTR